MWKLSLNRDRDAWNKSPEERLFLRRLDACLITYATLSYFSKYLDQQNVIVSVC
jgi:ACS family pantothenate transporter-like MFS transporter